LLHAFPRFKNLTLEPADDYIEQHQDAGDAFRETTGREDALAILGIGEIQAARLQQNGDKGTLIPACAYIIRSLKTPQEVEVLREVYGDAFFLMASSAPYQVRRRYIATRIAESRHDFRYDVHFPRAEELMLRDQRERGKKFGQNLQNTFHLADLFVDASEASKLKGSIERGLELVFGNTFHTPTRDEYGIFQATGAAVRSAELGRQVGAAISTAGGDIVSVGTNEVPKPGGGLYWAGDDPDHREFAMGEDANDRHKRGLLEDLLNRLRKDGWLNSEKSKLDPAQLASLALSEEQSPYLSGALLTHLIEFGRAVHAEMAAITDAARRGVSVAGTTMYVTTFPCHLCAPHIVSSGIRRVVYIEPYDKSLAVQLYPDSIAVDYSDRKDYQVHFEPFVGVAPRKYMQLFSMLSRKKDGKVLAFDKSTAEPRLAGSPRSYLQNETFALGALQHIIEEKQLMVEQRELSYERR
jgi:deoxycytidylate deaminase